LPTTYGKVKIKKNEGEGMVFKRYCNLVPRGFGPFGKHQEIGRKASIIHSGNSPLAHVQKPILYPNACAQSNQNQDFLEPLSQAKIRPYLILRSMAGLASTIIFDIPWYINDTR